MPDPHEAMEYLRAFERMQNNYKHEDIAGWMGEHTEIPVICVTAYLALVFYGRDFMQDRAAFNLKPLFTLWNLILSVFSFIGCASLSTALKKVLVSHVPVPVILWKTLATPFSMP